MTTRTGPRTVLSALATAGIIAAAAPALAAPPDTIPPSTPGTPVATQITETSALLTWRPSTDDTGVTEYEIWYLRGGGNGFYTNTGVPSYRLTGLTPDTAYTWMVRASDGRNQSGFSAPVTFRTDPAPPDAEPPGPPGTPVVSDVTASTVTLAWAASTDNASAPTYQLWSGIEGTGSTPLVGGLPGTSTRVTRLIPDLHYDFHLVARDVSGNVSAPSPATRARTAADPTASCRAGYRPGTAGQPSAVLVTNTGRTALSAWSVRFSFPDDRRIGYASHAWAQHGRDVVVWWSGWADQFSVGETEDVTLTLATPGTPDVPPSGVTLNGASCTGT
ncbi:fibronectin type III domain-containing protein [Plantactinospora sp. B6F1]|uniref:fibronectin type III domain-containing protein n=1 Tax=Plantactinospora sp. B6F1 TaxID=3158971 RepID=UPI0032D8F08F